MSGAHGFLGAAVVRELLERGMEVVALVTPWADLRRLAGLQFEQVQVDLSRAGPPPASLAGCSALVHLAALVRDWGTDSDFEPVNVAGTDRLLQTAVQAGIRRFVHVSSVAVHRYSGYFNSDPESAPLDGDLTAYARSKVRAELLVRNSGLDWTILRPGLWPYGRSDPTLSQVAQALRRRRLPLVAGGRSRLNTVYAGNFAHGVALALETGAGVHGTFVIADEGAPSWAELFTEIAGILGGAAPRLSLPVPLARLAGGLVEDTWTLARLKREPPLTRYRASLMQADLHFSDEPARRQLGYAPRHTREAALRLALAGR